MLQIIGLMVAFYILVRGLDYAAQAADADTEYAKRRFRLCGILAIIGAILFAVLLLMSGTSPPSRPY